MIFSMTTPGVSETARFVAQATHQELRPLWESNVFGLESVVRDELAAVWEECSEADWDGYEALPVGRDALHNVYRFLESLPFGYPAPSIGAEPDGDLTLEWHLSARRTLSVSVSPDAELHYAALIGPNKDYGTEVFFGEVPDRILELIRRVYSA